MSQPWYTKEAQSRVTPSKKKGQKTIAHPATKV